MNVPKQTADIFEILNKGKFISSNSCKGSIQKLHSIIEENQDELTEFFAAIGFKLECGEEYYYFSREENRASEERKIETAFKWIDYVDFLKSYHHAFGSGFRFSPFEILNKAKVDADLKAKLEALKKRKEDIKLDDILKRMLDELIRDQFIEEEDSVMQSYKVLASFTYLEDLILMINIPEDEEVSV